MANYKPRKCEVCGKEYIPTKISQRCCSKACSLKRWKSMNPEYCAPPREIKKCIICGTEFMPKRTSHICCSKKCTMQRNKETQLINDRLFREAQKAQEAMPESNHDAIAQLTIEATEQGLSYGQLEAKRWAEKNGFRLRKMQTL